MQFLAAGGGVDTAPAPPLSGRAPLVVLPSKCSKNIYKCFSIQKDLLKNQILFEPICDKEVLYEERSEQYNQLIEISKQGKQLQHVS